MEEGPCRAAIRVFYFDDKSQSCKRFIYGGCRGNDNNFETQKACRDACAPGSGSTAPSEILQNSYQFSVICISFVTMGTWF